MMTEKQAKREALLLCLYNRMLPIEGKDRKRRKNVVNRVRDLEEKFDFSVDILMDKLSYSEEFDQEELPFDPNFWRSIERRNRP